MDPEGDIVCLEDMKGYCRKRLCPVKAKVWNVIPRWTSKEGLPARRAAIEKLLIANDWHNKNYRQDAYTEASRMLTEWERMSKSERERLAPLTSASAPQAGTTTVSQNTVEKRETSQHKAKRFSADVQDVVRKLWESTNDQQRNRAERKAAFIVLSSAGVPPPQVHNYRELDQDDQHGLDGAENNSTLGDQKVERHTRQFVPSSNKMEKPGTCREVTTEHKKGNMGSRAAKIATMSYKDISKVQGLMYGGYKNRAWTTTVATKLYPLCTRNVVSGWVAQLGQKGIDDLKAKRVAECTFLGLKGWSQNIGDIQEDRASLDVPQEPEAERVREGKIESFVLGVSSGYISEICLTESVCPVCLWHELVGASVKEFKYEHATTIDVGNVKTNRSWVACVAKMHNKEQHALNGNIHSRTIMTGQRTRELLMGKDVIDGWNSPAIRCMGSETAKEIAYECEKYSFRSFYTDSNHGSSTTYVAAGTLHEPARGGILRITGPPEQEEWGEGDVGTEHTLEAKAEGSFRCLKTTIAKIMSQEVQVQLRRPRESTEVIEQQEDPTQISRTEQVDVRAEQTWIGVGFDRGKHHGKIVLTDNGEALAKALTDPNSKSGMIIPALSRNICYIDEGSGIAAACSNNRASDWRELGIRATLYDDIRERRFTQPTGVDWAVAKMEGMHTRYIPTTEEGWGYRASFVSWRYADRFLAQGLGIPIGEGEVWDICGDTTLVIGINTNASDSSCGLETWILSHLDYPLVYATDTFSIGTIRGTEELKIERKAFVRTSSLIDVHNRSRNILFVTNSDNIDDSFHGQTFKVTKLNSYGEVIANQMPRVYPFDAQIDSMLVLRPCASIGASRNPSVSDAVWVPPTQSRYTNSSAVAADAKIRGRSRAVSNDRFLPSQIVRLDWLSFESGNLMPLLRAEPRVNAWTRNDLAYPGRGS